MPGEKRTTMSRRAFVGSAAALTALPGNSLAESTDKLQMAGLWNNTRLAGLTLTEWRQRYHTCAERVRRHIEVGWDRVYGGLIHAINVGQTCYQWPVERPVGTSYAFRFTGEHHYMKTLWSLDEVLVSTLK